MFFIQKNRLIQKECPGCDHSSTSWLFWISNHQLFRLLEIGYISMMVIFNLSNFFVFWQLSWTTSIFINCSASNLYLNLSNLTITYSNVYFPSLSQFPRKSSFKRLANCTHNTPVTSLTFLELKRMNERQYARIVHSYLLIHWIFNALKIDILDLWKTMTRVFYLDAQLTLIIGLQVN